MRILLVLLLIIIFLAIIGFYIEKYDIDSNTNFDRLEDIVDCYVISMKREDRLKNIEEQQKKINIKINLYNAFDGRIFAITNQKKELKKKGLLDEKGVHFNRDEKKRNGEIGCALSHTGIYKMIKDKKKNNNYNKKYTIVLEDDVLLNEKFMENLEKGLRKIKNKNFDILYLSITWSQPGEKINDQIHKFVKGPIFGTYAYLINNDSIDKFVNLTKKIDNPIDWMLTYLMEKRNIDMYYFYPSICDITNMESIIHESL